MTNKEIIIDINTGERTEKPLSKEIIDFNKKINDERAAKEIELEKKAIAKAALLEKLGITAEEAALLLS